jgi:hypothetical protein
MRLVWYDDEKEVRYEWKLKPGHTYRIGRDPEWVPSLARELLIVDVTSGKRVRMDKFDFNKYISRIDPKKGKYGSVVIRYDDDGIKIARARNSTNPVCIYIINSEYDKNLAKAYLGADPGIELPSEEKEMINLTQEKKKFETDICVPIYINHGLSEDNLIAELYIE